MPKPASRGTSCCSEGANERSCSNTKLPLPPKLPLCSGLGDLPTRSWTGLPHVNSQQFSKVTCDAPKASSPLQQSGVERGKWLQRKRGKWVQCQKAVTSANARSRDRDDRARRWLSACKGGHSARGDIRLQGVKDTQRNPPQDSNLWLSACTA